MKPRLKVIAPALRQGRRCASVARLMEIKDVTAEDALRIRRIWKTYKARAKARNEIDEIIRTCGVEYLGWHRRACVECWYCNAGDSYATTIVFVGENLTVSCWADLVEKNLIDEKHSQQF